MFFVLSCVCYVFVRISLTVLCGHLLEKGWPLGSRLWCLTVSLSLSHWHPGSGVVLIVSIPDLCTLTNFVVFVAAVVVVIVFVVAVLFDIIAAVVWSEMPIACLKHNAH